jgi:hypothetical protein
LVRGGLSSAAFAKDGIMTKAMIIVQEKNRTINRGNLRRTAFIVGQQVAGGVCLGNAIRRNSVRPSTGSYPEGDLLKGALSSDKTKYEWSRQGHDYGGLHIRMKTDWSGGRWIAFVLLCFLWRKSQVRKPMHRGINPLISLQKGKNGKVTRTRRRRGVFRRRRAP